MIQLSITLQFGFDKDSVIVKVNGVEVFNKKSVTSHSVPNADQSFMVNVEEGSVTIEVCIPNRNLIDKKTLLLNKEKFLGLSIVKPEISPSGIRFIFLDENFEYF